MAHPRLWDVPALRSLPARRQAHWGLTPSGRLPLISSGGPPLRRPPLAATWLTRSNTALPFPHGSGGLTRNSLHLIGLAQTMPAAQGRLPEGTQPIPEGFALVLAPGALAIELVSDGGGDDSRMAIPNKDLNSGKNIKKLHICTDRCTPDHTAL